MRSIVRRAVLAGLLTGCTSSRGYIAEGDSIASRPDAYPHRVIRDSGFSPSYVLAVGGSRIEDLESRAPMADRLCSTPCFLSVGIGTNGLADYREGPLAYADRLVAYCDARAAAGFEVVICTLTPRAESAYCTPACVRSYNDRRRVLRKALLKTGHRIADFASDPIMGMDDSFERYGAFWTDGTHPSAIGQQRLAMILRRALGTVPRRT